MQSPVKTFDEFAQPGTKRPRTSTPSSKHELQKLGVVVFVKEAEKCSVGYASVSKDPLEPPTLSFLSWEKYREMHPIHAMDSLNVHRHYRNNSNFLCAGINAVYQEVVKNDGMNFCDRISRSSEEADRNSKDVFIVEELNALKCALSKNIAQLTATMEQNHELHMRLRAQLSKTMDQKFDELQTRCRARTASPLAAAETPIEKIRASRPRDLSDVSRPAKRNIDFSNVGSKLLEFGGQGDGGQHNNAGLVVFDSHGRCSLDSPPMMEDAPPGILLIHSSRSLTSRAREIKSMSTYSLHAQSCADSPALSSRSLPCAAM